MKILLVPFAGTDANLVERLAASLSDLFGCEVAVAPERPRPDKARDRRRGQSRSASYLKDMAADRAKRPAAIATGDAPFTVGVTGDDLFIPRLNFIFGEADREHRAAVVSAYRLRPEHYGFPPDTELLLSRLTKEAAHETGHLLGLDHCSRPGCVMQFSRTIEESDAKGPGFCPLCAGKLEAADT